MRTRFLYRPRRPYSLVLTAERYTRFPEVVDRFDGTTYRRLLPIGRPGVLLSVEQVGPPGRATLEVTLEGRAARAPEARAAALRLVARQLGGETNLTPFYRALREDPILAAAIRDFRGLRVAGVMSLWEALVTAVLCQQVNLRFAYDIRRELALAFGRRARFGGETFVTFPAPEAIARQRPSALRPFRLSWAKAATLVRLALAFASGVLSEEAIEALDDELAVERLISVKGVGRWTAEIGLLRGLGRLDVFPAADLGVVKYLAQGLLGRRAPSKELPMRRWAERWKPWRGLALIYAYAELARRQPARRDARRLAPPPRPRRDARGTPPWRRG